MSTLRERSNRLKPKSRAKYISFLGVLGLLVLPIATPTASATSGQSTVGMYLDQPFVQGSYVAEDFPSETSTTTFDGQTVGGSCSFNGAVLESYVSSTPDCHVQNNINFGGAGTTTSIPIAGLYPEPATFGQVGSGGASIVFSTPQTYFGMWWSAGSEGNEVSLMSGSAVVANVTANDVSDTLYNSASLTALSGEQYATSFYIGNPADWYNVGIPTSFNNQDGDNTYVSHQTMAREPFVYIHFIAASGTTFDRVNLIAPGNGFEFDNFTTSIATGIRDAGIPQRLVLQRELYEPAYVDFEANGGTGAMTRQYSLDNASAHLNFTCMPPYDDPARCISAPHNSYATQSLGWNTEPDGSGTPYYFDNWQPYSFNESMTVYAQWQTSFQTSYLTYAGNDFSADVTGETVWGYVDEYSYSNLSANNFADITLPAPTRQDQYLEGWYTFDTTNYTIVRAGSPGELVTSSTYTLWDVNLFGHWVDNPTPPPSADAITPDVLLVYPRASSVVLPNMPITGDVSVSICLLESDIYGNPVSSGLSYTDLSTSSSGMSTSYSISNTGALVTNASRYIRVKVSISSDLSCTGGFTHIVEVRPIGANFTKIVPLNLTTR